MWPAAAAGAAFSIQSPQRFAMGVEAATSSPYTTTTIRSFRDLKPTQFTVAKGKAINRAREKLWLSPAEQR